MTLLVSEEPLFNNDSQSGRSLRRAQPGCGPSPPEAAARRLGRAGFYTQRNTGRGRGGGVLYRGRQKNRPPGARPPPPPPAPPPALPSRIYHRTNAGPEPAEAVFEAAATKTALRRGGAAPGCAAQRAADSRKAGCVSARRQLRAVRLNEPQPGRKQVAALPEGSSGLYGSASRSQLESRLRLCPGGGCEPCDPASRSQHESRLRFCPGAAPGCAAQRAADSTKAGCASGPEAAPGCAAQRAADSRKAGCVSARRQLRAVRPSGPQTVGKQVASLPGTAVGYAI